MGFEMNPIFFAYGLGLAILKVGLERFLGQPA